MYNVMLNLIEPNCNIQSESPRKCILLRIFLDESSQMRKNELKLNPLSFE